MHGLSVYNDSDLSLENYPAWKKELILRKRASTRAEGTVATSQLLPANQCSQQGSYPERSSVRGHAKLQLAEDCSVSGPHYCSVQGPNKQLAHRSLSGPSILHFSSDTHTSSIITSGECGGVGAFSPSSQDNESVGVFLNSEIRIGGRMHHKGLHNPSYLRSNDENGSMSNGEEDLEYGPGIVSKLKNRYLSLAMRETKTRPALRRFSSLEDLLDAEESPAVETNVPRGRAVIQSSKREAMKRARSVDCLTAARRGGYDEVIIPPVHKSKSSRDALSSFTRDDVVIIESSKQNGKDQELKKSITPSLDKVREEVKGPVQNIKSVFVSNGQYRRPKPKPVGVSSVPKQSSPGIKPMPKAKPVGLTARRPESIQEAKVSLKQVTQVYKPAPKSSPISRTINGDTNNIAPILKSSLKSNIAKSPNLVETVVSKTFVLPSVPSLRNEKSIESTRVLLENRKNAQKSRQDEAAKTVDLVTPKPVVLVEMSPVKSTPRGPPPTLPFRNMSSPSVVMPPLPAPRLTPTSPIMSPLSPPVLTTPTRQNLNALVPSPTSTHHQSPLVKKYANGVSPSFSSSPMSARTSPTKQKAPAPQPQGQSNSFNEISKASPTKPLSSGTKSSQMKEAPVPGSLSSRPTTRPPSPPINPKHFVSLQATAPKMTSSPAPAVPSGSIIVSKPVEIIKAPTSGFSSAPSPILKTNSPNTLSSIRSAPKVGNSDVAPSPIRNVKIASAITGQSISSSPQRSQKSSGRDVQSSPVRTTKVTTFSSSGDEFTEVIEAVNTANRGGKGNKDRWHQEQTNSLVFNFIGKKDETPDYIENDGVDISKKINKVR